MLAAGISATIPDRLCLPKAVERTAEEHDLKIMLD